MIKKITAVLSFVLVLLLCGCWDKVDLNDRAFVISIGIDKYTLEESQKYAESKEEKDSKEDSTKNAAPVHSIEGENKRFLVSISTPDLTALDAKGEGKSKFVKKSAAASISSAFGLVDSYSSQKMYFGHSKVVVFGTDLLKDKELMKQAIDALDRSPEISRKVSVFATDKQAYNVLEADSPGEPLVGLFVSHFIKNSTDAAMILFKEDLQTFIDSLRETGNAVIPKINIESSDIQISGASVIKDFCLADSLSDFETRGYLWIKGNGTGSKVEAKYEGEYTVLSVTDSRNTIRFTENEYGGLVCQINININGTLSEYSFEKTLTQEKIRQIEKLYGQTVEDEVRKTYNKFRDEIKVDGYNLFKEMCKSDYKLSLKYENNWDEGFQNMEADIRCDVKIHTVGTTQ